MEASRRFVPVLLNGDKAEREGIRDALDAIRRHGIEVYPTVVFEDGLGNEIARSVRGKPPLAEAMEKALREYGKPERPPAREPAPPPSAKVEDPRLSAALRLDRAYRTDPDSLGKVERRFLQYCASCHGAAGNGVEIDIPRDQKNRPRDFTDARGMAALSDERLFTSIRDGYRFMPPFGRILSEERIRELVRHIRGLTPSEPAGEAR